VYATRSDYGVGSFTVEKESGEVVVRKMAGRSTKQGGAIGRALSRFVPKRFRSKEESEVVYRKGLRESPEVDALRPWPYK
jgi:hypothetical protein